MRGRLSTWNGTPVLRMWIVGTDRILGIKDTIGPSDDEKFEMIPKNVRERLDRETYLFGNYTFCPFTPERPGFMRIGCIQAAKNLRSEKQPE